MTDEPLDYGNECIIPLEWGGSLRTPAYPEECSYVRICDIEGREVAYWISDEWQESPEEVMGAIVGAMNQEETSN